MMSHRATSGCRIQSLSFSSVVHTSDLALSKEVRRALTFYVDFSNKRCVVSVSPRAW